MVKKNLSEHGYTSALYMFLSSQVSASSIALIALIDSTVK